MGAKNPNQRFIVAYRRQKLREQALAYKGGKCEICGYCRCPAAMDLHHIDSADKEFEISARMTSFEAIRAELDKCALLCSNCHREVHDGWHSGFIAHEDADRSADYDLHDLDASMNNEG